jgi:CRISPR-associated protein Cas1
VIGRILDISECAATLHVRYSQLVIEMDGSEVTTPLSDLAVLVISHPRVLMTQAVISGLAENGGSVVICGDKHLPSAMMLPLQTHTTQTERFAKQAQASLPLRKRLWQQIVQAKIRAQGRALRDLHGNDSGLLAMAERVRSGDVGNFESQASRRYWPLLFADPKFRRGSEGPDQNNHLNYGYAVLRATVARALCAAGLHPSLGLQHHNRYDPFCLANDLMEPFRPVIDRAVYHWVGDHDPKLPLDKNAKAFLVTPFTERYEFENESRTLFDLIARAASSLARAFMGESKQLQIPEV